jgi:glyoxylase I family protein
MTGIGGFFFRAKDPKALALWYQQHLGISGTPTSAGESHWQQEAGSTAFTPFKETSGYFGDMTKVWMLNFRVRDLDKMAAQLQAAGIEVKVDPQSYPYGLPEHLCLNTSISMKWDCGVYHSGPTARNIQHP